MRTRFVRSLVAAACFALSAASTVQATPNIARLDPNAKADQPGKYPKEMVPPGQSSFHGGYGIAKSYQSKDEKFVVGLWESGPGLLRTDGYPNDEYVRVLDGDLAITNRDGSKDEFKPGDSFVIPKGWAGTWDMKTKFKKQFVAVYDEAP